MQFLRQPPWAISITAFGVRLLYCAVAAFVLGKAAPGGTAHDGYLEIAQNLVGGQGYRLLGDLNFFRPPTYVMFLVPWVALPGTHFWILFAQSVVGAATCGMVTQLAMRFVSPRWAIAAGLALALCPWHVHFTANAMTPVLAGFLTMAFLMVWLRNREEPKTTQVVLCGAVYGAMALCHPGSVLIGPFWVLDRIVVALRAKTPARGIGSVGMFVLGAVLVTTPWVIRNKKSSGEWIILTNAAGFQYMVADEMVFRSPSIFVQPPFGATTGLKRAQALLQEEGFAPSKTLVPFKGVGIKEAKYCAQWMNNDLRTHPEKLIRRLLKQGWWFWFADDPSRVIFHLVYKVPILGLAFVGFWCGVRGRVSVLPIASCVLAYWVVHSAIMGHIPLAAYCLTVLGPTCILAAIGAQRLTTRTQYAVPSSE